MKLSHSFHSNADYADMLKFNLRMKLSKNIEINQHVIELKKGKQLPNKLIYNLESVELEILKIYIKINIKTGYL